MLNFFKKRRAERQRLAAIQQFGRESGEAMASAVDEYVLGRMGHIQPGYLDAFRVRLATSNLVEPGTPPEVVAQVEWDLFVKNVGTLAERLHGDTLKALDAWLRVAESAGMSAELDGYIQRRIRRAAAELKAEGLVVYAELAPKSHDGSQKR